MEALNAGNDGGWPGALPRALQFLAVLRNSSFIEEVNETLHSGDPEIRTWFLVRHSYLPFVLCSLYVLFVKLIGPAIMKNRKPFDLRLVMVAYNFLIVITYAICVGNICYITSFQEKKSLCLPMVVSRTNFTYKIATYGWIIYILKYVEFLDTIFFVLRKKDNLITNLQVSHHALLPLLGWVMLRTETSGFQAYPVGVNTVMHMIMYTYYGLAAMGPKVRKYLWWKRYLTIAQMVQFGLICAFVVIVMPLAGCTVRRVVVIVDVAGAIYFFTLFYNFYRHEFMSKRNVKISID